MVSLKVPTPNTNDVSFVQTSAGRITHQLRETLLGCRVNVLAILRGSAGLKPRSLDMDQRRGPGKRRQSSQIKPSRSYIGKHSTQVRCGYFSPYLRDPPAKLPGSFSPQEIMTRTPAARVLGGTAR
jgi:hypothetical protein